MKNSLALVTVLALLAAIVLLTSGCPNKPADALVGTAGSSGASPVADTPEPPAGSEDTADAVAPADGTGEPPVDWTWDKDTPIDPAAIPDAPAAGACLGETFIVRHAIVLEKNDEETGASVWKLRFFDTKPGPGEETWQYLGDRFLELTVPEAGEGTKTEVSYGSEEWELGRLWFWYQAPTEAAPNGVNANPGRDVALYLEFTGWDETPSPDNDDIIGAAKGKIGVGSEMFAGRDVCWIAGTFEAVILAP